MEHKDSDRARTERNLEDMMGDTWRLFRAKLVACERFEEQMRTTATENNNPSETRTGNLFTGALTSLCSSSKQQQQQRCDPFATPEEILAVCNQPRINVNKHRWAHPISHIEPGCVLIANERLGGCFHQTVILIIDHHEGHGTTGIVINRPQPGNFRKVMNEISDVDLSLELAFTNSTVTFGGPVSQDDYCVLHGYGEVDGSKKIVPGVFVGGSRELMHEVRKNNFDPRHALFVKGHASWLQSQLTNEVNKGLWYVASVSTEFMLRYADGDVKDGDNTKDLWSDILTCLGGSYKKVGEEYATKQGDVRVVP